MCGIIGIISKEHTNIGSIIHDGLLALQHRGPEAAGIFVNGKENKLAVQIKGKGLVSEVFKGKEKVLERPGNIGIGQVRYSTTEIKEDAQPFYLQIGGIMLAHNGHVINEKQLRRRLAKEMIFFNSDCDAETLLNVFAYYFNRSSGDVKEKCFKSVEKLMDITLGSYSVVAGINKKGLFVFRDPHGIRPLVYGKSNDSYIFSSETVAIDHLKNLEVVKPGEAIFIDTELNVSKKIIKKETPRHCMFEWVYFADANSSIEGRGVNEVRYDLGEWLAKLCLKEPAYNNLYNNPNVRVSPVPLTSIPIAISFSHETGIPYADCLIKNRYTGRTFLKPSQLERMSNVSSGIRPLKMVEGKIIIVIDDSLVRGTNGTQIVYVLKKAGAKEVHFLSACPPIIYPCYYGIDFHTNEELIAYGRTKGEIQKIIKANSLIYQTNEGLIRAIGLPEDNLCLGCLTGEYPTKLKQDIKL
jgi:amidophosphoribosyltransferase